MTERIGVAGKAVRVKLTDGVDDSRKPAKYSTDADPDGNWDLLLMGFDFGGLTEEQFATQLSTYVQQQKTNGGSGQAQYAPPILADTP